MKKSSFKLNFTTKFKMMLGLDTRADELNIKLDELNRSKNRIDDKARVVSQKLSYVNSVITNIDKVEELAKKDILSGHAEDLSIKVMSSQLSIERAKKKSINISKIVEMEQDYTKLVDACIASYIDNVIAGIVYSDSSCKEVINILNNISHTLSLIGNTQASFSSYADLISIKENMMKLQFGYTGQKNKYSDASSKKRSSIVAIENSDEKRMADYAVDLAKSKRKR